MRSILVLLSILLASLPVLEAAADDPLGFGDAWRGEVDPDQPLTMSVFDDAPAIDTPAENGADHLPPGGPADPGLVPDGEGTTDENLSPSGVGTTEGEGEEDAEDETATHFEDIEKRLEEIEGELFAPVTAPTFDIGGRIHADYWGFPSDTAGIGFFENPSPASAAFGQDPEDRFQFRRIRLEMRGDIFETMNWRIQIDFNNPAVAEMKDVWIGFKELPNNQAMLIGNHKRPLGMDHLNSSRFNVFLERPLVVEAFNEDARRPGIAVWGHTDDESVGWAYGAFLLENISTDGRYIGDAKQGSLNARLWCSPWYDECSDGRGFLHLGIAGMFADPDGSPGAGSANSNEARFRTRPSARSTSRWIDTGRVPGADLYEILALEAMLNVGSLEITSEFQTAWMQRDDVTPGTGPDLFFHGGYVHVGYFLTGESMVYNRKAGVIGRVKPFENFFFVDRCCGGVGTGWGAWQVAGRLSYLDLSSGDTQGGRELDATLALNWFWTSHSKLQFNVIYGGIDQHRPVGGFTSGDFLIVGTRFAAEF